MSILLSINLISSFTFVFLSHPLSMGLVLFIQTTMIALITGFLNMNFWYSYILFLIMIGGMLVLFMYMTSVASNEKFTPSIKLTMMIMLLIMMMMIFFMMMDTTLIYLNNFYLETQMNTIEYTMTFTKFINFPMYIISLTLFVYLLIALIAVVKITDIKSGPLRQKLH